MEIDVLVAEIGSTTTVVNGFMVHGEPQLVGQGQAATTVEQGDVRTGIQQAIKDLQNSLGCDFVEFREMFATSSAAGGLKMTVHGLIYDMTVKAAREAALGAGGILKMATAGRLRPSDLEQIGEHNPNLILLAGGTDYGERDTALHNAEVIAGAQLGVPVIYAGNVENQREVSRLFTQAGQQVYLTENVYPKLDILNIEPTRKIIHQVFEEHIIKAPGMEHVRDILTGNIIPTPGAVMECAKLLYDEIGDLIVFDVGGATTDIHSVTEGSDEIGSILINPEPVAKRTVEGDLGVYVNAASVLELCDISALQADLGIDPQQVLRNYCAIPKTPEEFHLVGQLAQVAAETALKRHGGQLRHIFTPTGRKTLAEGKDLTQTKWLVATGGALTRLPNRQEIMVHISCINKNGMMLFPSAGKTSILYDRDYTMASLGVLAKAYPEAALILLKKSLGI